jgi:hypothetical protein
MLQQRRRAFCIMTAEPRVPPTAVRQNLKTRWRILDRDCSARVSQKQKQADPARINPASLCIKPTLQAESQKQVSGECFWHVLAAAIVAQP